MFQSARFHVLYRYPCYSFQEVSGYTSSQIPIIALDFLNTAHCNLAFLDFVFLDLLRLISASSN